MIASIKKSGFKLKSSIIKQSNRVKMWAKRHKKRIIIPSVIIACIALTAGLVLGAYKGVDIIQQAVIINYTEEKIINGTHNNEVNLIGLNSIYYQVPKRKFLIYFEQAPVFDGKYWSPKITARSSQGTKLIVSARISCQIAVNSLKDFLQQYGLNWKKYVIEKSKNVVIQKIAQTKFYELNNSLILSKVNSQFSLNKLGLSDYPFNMKLISLKIEYPTGSFSVNNTLGIQLLSQKSLYSQLTSNYDSLNNKINSNISEITNLSANIGTLQSQVRLLEMQVNSLDPNWMAGLSSLNSTIGGGDELRKYLWLYFQKLYNSTYNNYSLY